MIALNLIVCWALIFTIIGILVLQISNKKITVFLNGHTRKPTKGTEKSKGLDIYSPTCFEIKPMEMKVYDTEIVVDYYNMNEFFCDCALNIYPRSSLSSKKIVILGNSLALIDPDYNGRNDTLKLILINLSKETQSFSKDERIAQIVFNRTVTPKVIIKSIQECNFKDRGGLGSTGA